MTPKKTKLTVRFDKRDAKVISLAAKAERTSLNQFLIRAALERARVAQ